jgi:hypothetical protein
MLQGLKLAVALAHPYILAHHSLFSPYLFPCAWQKERGLEKRRKRWKKGSRKKYQDIKGVAFPSSLSHDGVGLDSFHCYARPPSNTLESWVYGGGGA